MLQDKLIDGLRKELETNRDIEDIVIFGSAARTNFQKYNDIDILMIFKDTINSNQRASIIGKLENTYNLYFHKLVKFDTVGYGGFAPRLILNYGGYKKDEKYHTFYCDKRELKVNHPIIDNIVNESLSIRNPQYKTI